MKRPSPLTLFVLTALTTASPTAGLPPRAVFAKHDPNGNLPNTRITRLGVIRVRSAAYTIYYLEFSNPISLHGQSRISIIKNDRQFMGSYECDDLWIGR